MKGFPTKTPILPKVSIKFDGGSKMDFGAYPRNHLLGFRMNALTGECEWQLYDYEGMVTDELSKILTDKNKSLQNVGVKLSWGYASETGEWAMSPEHNVNLSTVKGAYSKTGIIYSFTGFSSMTGIDKTVKSLQGNYSGSPVDAINAAVKDACDTAKMPVIETDFTRVGNIKPDKIEIHGNNQPLTKVLSDITDKCIAEKEQAKIYYSHMPIGSHNKLVFRVATKDIADSGYNINKEFFDGKPFEFPRSGGPSYVLDYTTDEALWLLYLSSGIMADHHQENSKGPVTSEGTPENSSEGTPKETKVQSSGTAASTSSPGKNFKVAMSTTKPDDPAGSAKDQIKNKTQALDDQLRNQVSISTATFVGNPQLVGPDVCINSILEFIIYNAGVSKELRKMPMLCGKYMSAGAVIHEITGGVYTTKFEQLIRKPLA